MICPFSKYKKTAHFEKTKISPSLIVIHYTQTFSIQKAFSILQKRKLSAHFVLDELGKIVQLVDTENKAWHAGKSRFKGKENLNNSSIGIELVNPGFVENKDQWNFGYTNCLGKKWGNWPHVQIRSLCKLLAWLQKNHPECVDIVGHSDISPGRKIDPGPIFPWEKIKRYMTLQ